MQGRWTILGLMLAATLAGSAEAQDKTTLHGTVIAIDSIAGGMYVRPAKTDSSNDESAVRLGTFMGGLSIQAPSPTRLGIHQFLGDTLTLGIGLYYGDHGSLGTSYVLAPRIGAAFPIGESTSFWLRGGIAYWHCDENFVTMKALLPGGEALFVLTAAEHFAFTLGVVGEASVWGKAQAKSFFGGGTSSPEQDINVSQVGFSFGALAYF
jgi:hypothetical protein